MPDAPARLLAPAEVEALTGYRRPSAQVRALRMMGIEHWVRPDGRPVVRADWRSCAVTARVYRRGAKVAPLR